MNPRRNDEQSDIYSFTLRNTGPSQYPYVPQNGLGRMADRVSSLHVKAVFARMRRECRQVIRLNKKGTRSPLHIGWYDLQENQAGPAY
jgi:hypothetical protein